MKRLRPSDLRRDPRLGNYARDSLTAVENWAAKNHGPLTILEIEAPMNIAEELGLLPTADGKGHQTPDGHVIPGAVLQNLQKAADAWRDLPPEARAALGHVRYHFHVNGVVHVQPIDDPRKGGARGLAIKVR